MDSPRIGGQSFLLSRNRTMNCQVSKLFYMLDMNVTDYGLAYDHVFPGCNRLYFFLRGGEKRRNKRHEIFKS